jgi:hypothetical protein
MDTTTRAALEAEALRTAEIYARVTGSVSSTASVERRNEDGTLESVSATWTRPPTFRDSQTMDTPATTIPVAWNEIRERDVIKVAAADHTCYVDRIEEWEESGLAFEARRLHVRYRAAGYPFGWKTTRIVDAADHHITRADRRFAYDPAAMFAPLAEWRAKWAAES